MLDRTVGKPEDQEQDNQLNQFVPDLNVVGKSSTLGQVCVPVIANMEWLQIVQSSPSQISKVWVTICLDLYGMTFQVDYESDEEEEEVGPAVKTSTKSGGMFSMFSSLVRFSFVNTNTNTKTNIKTNTNSNKNANITQMQRSLIPGWFQTVDQRRSHSSSGKVEGQSYWEECGQ